MSSSSFTPSNRFSGSFKEEPFNRIDFSYMPLIHEDIRKTKTTLIPYDSTVISFQELRSSFKNCWNQLLEHQRMIISPFIIHIEYTEVLSQEFEKNERLQKISQTIMRLFHTMTLDEAFDSQPILKETRQEIFQFDDFIPSPSSDIIDDQDDVKIQQYLDYSQSALQELVSDLFMKYINPSQQSASQIGYKYLMPPLVSWCNKIEKPFFRAAMQNGKDFIFHASLIDLPYSISQGGIAAWILAYEGLGYEILNSREGLIQEISTLAENTIHNTGSTETNKSHFQSYFNSHTKKFISDILSVLHLGPSAPVALLAYSKFLYQKNDQDSKNSYQDQLIRLFGTLEVLRSMNYKPREKWATAIENEILKEWTSIDSSSMHETLDWVRPLLSHLINKLTTSPLETLHGCSLKDIYAWNDEEETRAHYFRKIFKQDEAHLPVQYQPIYKSNHVVAAAILEAFEEGADLSKLFRLMISSLRIMHLANPFWRPCETREELADEKNYDE